MLRLPSPRLQNCDHKNDCKLCCMPILQSHHLPTPSRGCVSLIRPITSVLRAAAPPDKQTLSRVQIHRLPRYSLQYGQHHRRHTAASSSSRAPADPQAHAQLAVFVSGGGSNLKAIHKSIQESRLRAVIKLIISDKPSCGGWQYAEEQGIATLHYNPKNTTGLSGSEVVDQLQAAGIEYVALAGYLKLIPAPLVAAYHRRMVNIHPGLLPEFGGPSMYGMRVHAATLAAGVKESGATVHFVDEVYDQGPILQKATVPVLPDDTPATLAARVLEQEHVLYSQALSHLVEGRVRWDEASQTPSIVSQ